jgi:hypothetical protein
MSIKNRRTDTVKIKCCQIFRTRRQLLTVHKIVVPSETSQHNGRRQEAESIRTYHNGREGF